MNDLSPDGRSLLDAARARDHLDAADRRRIRAGIAAQIALASSVGVGASLAEASTSAAPSAMAASLKVDAAAKLTWSLATLSSAKGVAVAVTVAALSTGTVALHRAHGHGASARVASNPHAAPARPTHRDDVTAHPSPTVVAAVPPSLPTTPPSVVAMPSVEARAAKPSSPQTATPRVISTTRVVAPPVRVTVTVVAEPDADANAPPTPPAPHAAVPREARAEGNAATPDASAPLATWECAREIDRALLRDAPNDALHWVARCRTQIDGPHGGALGAREVMALCAADRMGDAVLAARRVLAVDGSPDVRHRIGRTCARAVAEPAP